MATTETIWLRTVVSTFVLLLTLQAASINEDVIHDHEVIKANESSSNIKPSSDRFTHARSGTPVGVEINQEVQSGGSPRRPPATPGPRDHQMKERDEHAIQNPHVRSTAKMADAIANEERESSDDSTASDDQVDSCPSKLLGHSTLLDMSGEDKTHSLQSPERNVHVITWDTPPSSPSQPAPLLECTCDQICPYVNCAFRNFTAVPKFSFGDTVISLDLYNNSITKISNYDFIVFVDLENLNLCNNSISVLETNAFCGLRNLRHLNLWNNNLTMIGDTFAENVFTPLVSLLELRLNRNNPNLRDGNYSWTYPDRALSRLTNLTTLYMDGLSDKDLGRGFQNLTFLTSLTLAGYMAGYCSMNSLKNTTFQYLVHLEYLDISACYILGKNIQAGTFSPLSKLITLNITHNEDIDIPYLNNVFYGLRNTVTLKRLEMHLIVNRYSVGICLDSWHIRDFPQHLTYLDAGENSIEGINREVISLLSPSLETLVLSGNTFVFGTYLLDLPKLKNLKELYVNGGTFTYSLPVLYPFEMPQNSLSKNCTLYDPGNRTTPGYEKFVLFLPPNLTFVKMNKAGLTYILSELEVDPNNSLEELYLQENKFPLLQGPFNGLHSLTVLDVSKSFVKEISTNFFVNLTSLQKLNLEGNLLGNFFSDNGELQVFSPLVNLKSLNLSFNDIQSLPTNIFFGLNNLEELWLYNNRITEFVVTITHMQHLKHLVLKDTRLARLPLLTRQHIDALIGNHVPILIAMDWSPIACDCQNMPFLTWMTQSKAFDRKFQHYECTFPDSSYRRITDGYNETMQILNRQCSSNVILFLCVGACTLVAFSIIICSILYRFRWKIRYLYYAAYMYYRRQRKASQHVDFQYDAFISYDESDVRFVVRKLCPELERRGLKLCIHSRDFTAGEYIASNIVKAVCKSRRTVVVLTRHMIDSYWCGYEIQMANMEAVHTGRPVLIFLLMEKIPESDLGVELLYNIRNNTYIPYPDPLPDATSIGRLWDKLAADIRE